MNKKSIWMGRWLICLPIFLIFFGCNPQRKIDKATQVVLMNEDARNFIFSKVAKLNPCANDTTIIKKSDTIYTDIIGTITDTIRRQDTVYIKDTLIKRTTRQVDRYNYIVDRRLLNSQEDSTKKYYKMYSQTNSALSEERYEAKKWRLWFLLLWLIIVIFSVIKIYIKFATKRII